MCLKNKPLKRKITSDQVPDLGHHIAVESLFAGAV